MTLLRPIAGLIRRTVDAFVRDTSGQMAVIFAIGIPAVALLAAGAVDLSAVSASKIKLQDVADASALAGANELGLAISDDAAIQRAAAFVDGSVSEWKNSPRITKAISIIQREGQRVIEVKLDGHSPSFFGSMLPPGGWKFHAASRAVQVGLTPLCVLVSGGTGKEVLKVENTSRLAAPECLVHSNRDINVKGGSIAAYQVQAVTSAKGSISPAPGTGAAPINDPFAGMTMKQPSSCPPVDLAVPDIATGEFRLSAGVHCGKFAYAGDAVLRLAPGEHWFASGSLEMKGNARLVGDDVVLFFDKASKFDFRDQSSVSLNGRKTGQYAGMVLVSVAGNTEDFAISSEHVDSLLGVIYIPDARLIVDGKSAVARDSAWTVIVARELQLKGSPSLVINANYSATSVPVPSGVGPRIGGSQLVP